MEEGRGRFGWAGPLGRSGSAGEAHGTRASASKPTAHGADCAAARPDPKICENLRIMASGVGFLDLSPSIVHRRQ